MSEVVIGQGTMLWIFGLGFLGGSLFALVILMVFDWIKARNKDDKKL